MSWHIETAGNAAEMEAKIPKLIERECAFSHHTDLSREVIRSHGSVGLAVAKANPGTTVYFKSSGHADNGHANAFLEARRLHGIET